MRYLAIDYGDKRTGLAICDPQETVVSPLLVIEGQKNLIEKIADVIETENAQAIVIGLPLNMDGSAGPRAKLVQQFADKLKNRINVPIFLQDERLTSFAAEQQIAPAGLTRKKKKKRLDAIAAAQILDAFLKQNHEQA